MGALTEVVDTVIADVDVESASELHTAIDSLKEELSEVVDNLARLFLVICCMLCDYSVTVNGSNLHLHASWL